MKALRVASILYGNTKELLHVRKEIIQPLWTRTQASSYVCFKKVNLCIADNKNVYLK